MDKIIIPKEYDVDNMLVTNHYGIGLYGSDSIRCVRVIMYNYFKATRVEISLLDAEGNNKGVVSSYANNEGEPIITTNSWLLPDTKYKTSLYNFTFYDYIPSQKIIFPNISYGKTSINGVLYRDENGFLKIS